MKIPKIIEYLKKPEAGTEPESLSKINSAIRIFVLLSAVVLGVLWLIPNVHKIITGQYPADQGLYSVFYTINRLPLFLIAILLLILLLVFNTKIRHDILMKRGIKTYAKIVNVEHLETKQNELSKPKKLVKITLEHREPIKKVWLFDPERIPGVKIGDEIEFIYDPQYPKINNLVLQDGKPVIKNS